ncbi:hypothetical protein FRC07_002699 [Ceratobasidium sp. 392]|nr:hypothetical protein FRC07_002699 [Ceratobasidium sp. 392]
MAAHPALIVLFGAKGTGKTTFVNDASGGDLAVGNNLQANDQDVALSNVFQVDGRDVVLIDTPSFDDAELLDVEILQCISVFLGAIYEAGYKLAGIIYLHRITEIGTGRITRRTFEIFLELCGQEALANVFIVINMWSDPPFNVQLEREEQLRDGAHYFRPAIAAGAQLVRRPRKDTDSAHNIIRLILDKNPVVMQVQRELVDNKQGFFTTSATRLLAKELVDMEERHQGEVAQAMEELRQAEEENDVMMQQDLFVFLAQANVESTRLAKKTEALRRGFDEEWVKWKKQIDIANQERQEAERQLERLQSQLEHIWGRKYVDVLED